MAVWPKCVTLASKVARDVFDIMQAKNLHYHFVCTIGCIYYGHMDYIGFRHAHCLVRLSVNAWVWVRGGGIVLSQDPITRQKSTAPR